MDKVFPKLDANVQYAPNAERCAQLDAMMKRIFEGADVETELKENAVTKMEVLLTWRTMIQSGVPSNPDFLTTVKRLHAVYTPFILDIFSPAFPRK